MKKTKILFSGRSMIEMLGVLAIMGIITGMSIAAYNMAMGTLKSGRTTEDLTRIQQAVRSLYTEGVYKDIQTSTFISLGTITAFGTSTTAGRNQYGGEYTISSTDTDNLTFSISVTAVPKTDCVTFMTRVNPGLYKLGIGENAVELTAETQTAVSIVDNCADNVTVVFTYK